MNNSPKNQRDIQEIISYIKDLISIKVGNRKVLDVDVANSLEISDGKLYTCKYRGVIPYENIVYFCQKENILLDKILFKS
jgi:hypothetical protein